MQMMLFTKKKSLTTTKARDKSVQFHQIQALFQRFTVSVYILLKMTILIFAFRHQHWQPCPKTMNIVNIEKQFTHYTTK